MKKTMAMIVALAIAGGAAGNEVVLFDAATGPAPVEGGNIVVNGNWDLSDCDTVTVSFKDAKLVNDSYVVELSNADGDFRARRGVYTARLAVKRDGFKDESAPLPPDLGTWRDTMARLSSMRNWALPKQVWDFDRKDVSFYAAQRNGGVVCDSADMGRIVKMTVGMRGSARGWRRRVSL